VRQRKKGDIEAAPRGKNDPVGSEMERALRRAFQGMGESPSKKGVEIFASGQGKLFRQGLGPSRQGDPKA
jgi:hypothetical protein